jgi:hypothetical protein
MRVQGLIPGRGKRYFLLHCMQTDSGAHPASYPMGTRVSFPGVKQPGHKADHSPPFGAEVTNIWIYTSTPPFSYVFMTWCLIK